MDKVAMQDSEADSALVAGNAEKGVRLRPRAGAAAGKEKAYSATRRDKDRRSFLMRRGSDD
jgi:hypothetical protein